MADYIKNPFTPSFGVAPLFMAGRDALVGELLGALDNWPGDPSLSTVVIGARGTGKTSLLSVVASEAGALGWITADVSASEGMLQDIFERSLDSADAFLDQKAKARLKSLGIGGLFSAEWEYRDPASGNWRTRMNRVLDALTQSDVGLLITVDEVRADFDEMIQLASVYQHFVRERRKVALLMAGLPDNVAQLVDNKSVSFLRRAARRDLNRIGDEEVRLAAARTVEAGGRTIQEKALDVFASEVEGFPYMIQLVGYRAWNAGLDRSEITVEDVTIGARLAREDMRRQVIEPTWAGLAKGDRVFLSAMAELGGQASLANVSKQIGKATNYTTKNKSRLLERGILQTAPNGNLEFALPGMREYVLEIGA